MRPCKFSGGLFSSCLIIKIMMMFEKSRDFMELPEYMAFEQEYL